MMKPTEDNVKKENIQDDESAVDFSPESELEKLKIKSQEYLDGWRRAKADYLNLKKEAEKQSREMIGFANAALLSELLPIFDHFKLALKHVPKDQKDVDWVAGFGHIKNQFDEFFKKIGIEEIKTVGEKFNPELHEAIVSEKHKGVATGVIFEEVKSGYSLYGKVINPAQVKVAE